MPKSHAPVPPKVAALAPTSVVPETVPHHEPHREPHTDITSPAAVHANDRMKLASKPNGGQPLSHRDRGKAGRKG